MMIKKVILKDTKMKLALQLYLKMKVKAEYMCNKKWKRFNSMLVDKY